MSELVHVLWVASYPSPHTPASIPTEIVGSFETNSKDPAAAMQGLRAWVEENGVPGTIYQAVDGVSTRCECRFKRSAEFLVERDE